MDEKGVTENTISEPFHLTHYRILEKLGSGGMGDVYLADDVRLGRKVALKMLSPKLADDPERRRMFRREAKAAATLNHPNIVTVYGVEEEENAVFIVMERVNGVSLASKILPGGITLDQFLDWSISLSDAIAAAHRLSIVHRDLKPTNIMISDDGRLKVLDFGLAKTVLMPGLAYDNVSTMAAMTAMTNADRIVGTVPYMSPEQAQGSAVDQRSDIFSLGVVFFEMLTGERPFHGDTGVGLLASILRDPAPLVTARNAQLPPRIATVIDRCLKKDPDERYQSALDLHLELKELRDELAAGVLPLHPPSFWTDDRHRPLRLGLGLLALLCAGGLGYLVRGLGVRTAAWVAPGPAAAPSVVKLTQLTREEGPEVNPSMAPDGTWLAYAARNQESWDLFRIRVGGEIPMNLTPDTPEDDTEPAISPDGNLIAFRSERAGGGIYIIGATGESARRVSDFGHHPSWTPDQHEIIVTSEVITDPRQRYHADSQVWAIDPKSGNKRKLTTADAVHGAVSPHGQRMVYWSLSHGAIRDLATVPFVSGGAGPPASPTLLTDDPALDWSPAWSPDGRFIYFSSDRGGCMNIWRLRIDESSGRALSAPSPVILNTGEWSYAPSFSSDGRRMVFVSGGPVTRLEKIRFDRNQLTTRGSPIRLAIGDQTSISPQGDWAVFRSIEPTEDLGIVGSDGRGLRKLTDDPPRDRLPRIAPDGKRIAFVSDRSGQLNIWFIDADGSHLEQFSQGGNHVLPVWSPDGKQMALYDIGKGTLLVDPNRPWNQQTPRPLKPFPKAGATFSGYAWSPDGRLLAGYVSLAGGEAEGVWVYELATGSYRELIAGPSQQLSWLNDSRTLIYASGNALLLLDSRTQKLTQILAFPEDRVLQPVVSADNQWIYYHRSSLDANLWMATLASETPSSARTP